ELSRDVENNGYYGGIRLMKAAIRRFWLYCRDQNMPLPDRNFSIRYRSTIPRRLGLAGSSALVTATIRCLMEFYDIDIPKPLLPGLILSVETEELGIAAGLQDRVIQVYEGVVYMDFQRVLMEAQGHGNYEKLNPALLPPLFIAYREDLGEGSETIHQTVRDRWLAGDAQVLETMEALGECARQARDLLLAGKGTEIGPLFDRNFELRCSIFKVDQRNKDMITCAKALGAHAKLAGSGGAIIGIYEDEAMYQALAEAFQKEGIAIFKPQIEPEQS
ncbi:MAG TPA: GHMP kinase, partial [Candidatus Hydrogenedentes bacterium]|nr:GHMP kinase [Candidatus Hydrogenedentota bacterium]